MSNVRHMGPEDRRKLVAGWIEHHTERIERDADNVFYRVRGADNFWAWEQLMELCQREPRLAWEILLEILGESENEAVRGSLAAGPLEDLLAWHGEDLIDQVEALASVNPTFKELLHGVWRNATSADIWARVEAARCCQNHE